ARVRDDFPPFHHVVNGLVRPHCKVRLMGQALAGEEFQKSVIERLPIVEADQPAPLRELVRSNDEPK
ncbi:MAG: hypothetical protein HC809_15155, partial [Gammaproteobacteria bacterium]|nr:hypothetical protein [Gammaproteobacteria bacterium]